MELIESPCTKVCTLHPHLQICTGCGRTPAEIESWLALSREQRIGLIEIVRQRLQAARDRNWMA
ncbi:MAG: DUF1289 domain-containing protein [Xanthobacteraceae bacterium]